MESWQFALITASIVFILIGIGAALAWRHISARVRSLARRIRALPAREKMRLARALASDAGLSPPARIVLPAVVLYLGLTFDLLPDFIPVFGRLDDLVVLAVGVGLFARRKRFEVIEAHLAAIEAGLGVVVPALSLSRG